MQTSGTTASLAKGSIGDIAACDAFRRDGFAVLTGLLHPDEVEDARHDVDEVLVAPRVGGCDRPFNALTSLRWDDRLVRRVLASPTRIAAIADAIGAGDLRVCQREGRAESAAVVASRLVVLGPPAEFPSGGSPGFGAVLPKSNG